MARKPSTKKPAVQPAVNETAASFSAVREAPKPDPARAPQDNELGRLERTGDVGDINADEPGEDKLYSVASRARWGTDNLHELSQDAAEAERLAAEKQE